MGKTPHLIWIAAALLTAGPVGIASAQPTNSTSAQPTNSTSAQPTNQVPAQPTNQAPAAPVTPASNAGAAAEAPAPLVLYFNTGSTRVRPEDEAVLDHASRLFSEGNPIVMIVTGSTDLVGRPDQNLLLSQQRAASVLQGLLARGLPAGRFQVLAKGATEPAVQTAQGVAEQRNRRVEISWR